MVGSAWLNASPALFQCRLDPHWAAAGIPDADLSPARWVELHWTDMAASRAHAQLASAMNTVSQL